MNDLSMVDGCETPGLGGTIFRYRPRQMRCTAWIPKAIVVRKHWPPVKDFILSQHRALTPQLLQCLNAHGDSLMPRAHTAAASQSPLAAIAHPVPASSSHLFVGQRAFKTDPLNTAMFQSGCLTDRPSSSMMRQHILPMYLKPPRGMDELDVHVIESSYLDAWDFVLSQRPLPT
jgi:hypothetical protein